MKTTKMIASLLALTIGVGLVSSCGGNKQSAVNENDQIVIRVGNWPDPEANAKLYASRMLPFSWSLIPTGRSMKFAVSW